MKISLAVPLLDLSLVTITTQLSKIQQFIFITNGILKIKLYYGVSVLVSVKYKNWPSMQL